MAMESKLGHFVLLMTLLKVYINYLFSNYKLPVNIGNPNEYSINTLFKIIKSKINTSSKTVYKDLPENDPKIRKPSIDLAMNILKWEPKINLSKGLDQNNKIL